MQDTEHTETAAIDFGHLRSFTLGDDALEKELSSLFDVNSTRYISLLREAMDDQAAWEEAAHRLKGVGRSIGAFQLAELAEAAENLDDDTKKPDMIEALTQQAETVRLAMRQYIAQKTD